MEEVERKRGEEEIVIISSLSCESQPVLRPLPGKLEMHTNCLYSKLVLPDSTVIAKQKALCWQSLQRTSTAATTICCNLTVLSVVQSWWYVDMFKFLHRQYLTGSLKNISWNTQQIQIWMRQCHSKIEVNLHLFSVFQELVMSITPPSVQMNYLQDAYSCKQSGFQLMETKCKDLLPLFLKSEIKETRQR